MTTYTESDIEQLVRSDAWMMKVLRAARSLNLPDWWIGAGFLRNKVWDAMEGNDFQVSRDVDLVYFSAADVSPETDWQYDEQMNEDFPFAEWEVRNQARMHTKNGFDPYGSTAEGIAHWVETATCVALRLSGERLEFLYCHGSDDLLGMIARPTPGFQTPELRPIFYERIEQKKWRERWPSLTVLDA